MALKAVLKSLDGVEESLKPLYRQDPKGQLFVLDVEPVDGWNLEDVAGLKSTVSKTREELKTAREALKPYTLDEQGSLLDAAKARDALGRIDELAKAADPERVKAAVAKQLDELKAEHKKLLDTALGESKVLEEQLHEVLIDRDAMTALQGKTDFAKVLLPHVKNRIKIERGSDGRRVARIVDEDGRTPMLSMKQGSSDPMGLDELVESFSRNAQFAPLFRGSGASGGDTPAGKAKIGGSGQFRITVREAEQDPSKYRALREQAAKVGQSVQLVE
jgi:hypothetical protein